MASKFAKDINKSELELLEKIGEGTYGKVYKARRRKKELVVVKILKKKDDPEIAFVGDILSSINHENIIKCFGMCTTQDKAWIVMEYAEYGCIFDILHNTEPESVNNDTRLNWIQQGARGLNYLHTDLKIMHRDFKSLHLVLAGGGTVKICDFGTATSIERSRLTNEKGSILWMAPEVIEGSKYSEKCDVYSFGIVSWEVFTHRIPYEGACQNEVRFQVVAKYLRPPLKDIPEQVADLMTRCWDKDPASRPPLEEILKILGRLMQSSLLDLHTEETVTQATSGTANNNSKTYDEGSIEARDEEKEKHAIPMGQGVSSGNSSVIQSGLSDRFTDRLSKSSGQAHPERLNCRGISERGCNMAGPSSVREDSPRFDDNTMKYLEEAFHDFRQKHGPEVCDAAYLLAQQRDASQGRQQGPIWGNANHQRRKITKNQYHK